MPVNSIQSEIEQNITNADILMYLPIERILSLNN